MTRTTAPRRIDFAGIAAAALARSGEIVPRWLPDGRREGSEWTARNLTRVDHRLGSFRVNLKTGRWGDFSTGDKGGDLIALAAFLFSLDMGEAARRVADMCGVPPHVE